MDKSTRMMRNADPLKRAGGRRLFQSAASSLARLKKLALVTAAAAVVAVPTAALLTANNWPEPHGPEVEDAYTVSTFDSKNYGEQNKIAIGLDHEDRKNGYFKFNNVRAPSDGETMELQLTVVGGKAGTLTVHAVGSGWDEKSITWRTAPVHGDVVGHVRVSGGGETVRIALDGAAPVKGTVSLAVTRDDGGITRVAARESGASLAPQLTTSKACAVSDKLVPSCGVWLGATANPLDGESWDQALADFEETAGRTMDIAHYYARGQDKLFPSSEALARQNEAGKNRILFYNWRPSDLTWAEVADGAADSYLRDLAAHMKASGKEPFFLSLNAEMEDEVDMSAGSGQTATDYRDFFRHVVTLLRSNGVENVVTVMNYTGFEKWGEMPWFETLYPGNDVVDWLAQDPYSFGMPPVWLTDFEGIINRSEGRWPGFYNWAATHYPDKPQMLGEWGVDENPAYPGFKTGFFETAAQQLAKYPKIKALVYWNSSGTKPDGSQLAAGDTRVDSSSSALRAFQIFAGLDLFTAPREGYFD